MKLCPEQDDVQGYFMFTLFLNRTFAANQYEKEKQDIFYVLRRAGSIYGKGFIMGIHA